MNTAAHIAATLVCLLPLLLFLAIEQLTARRTAPIETEDDQ